MNREKLIKDLMSVAEAYKEGNVHAIGAMTDMGLLLDNFMQAESQKNTAPKECDHYFTSEVIDGKRQWLPCEFCGKEMD